MSNMSASVVRAATAPSAELAVVCVSARPWFRAAVARAVHDLTIVSGGRTVVDDGAVPAGMSQRREYREVVAPARAYLDRHLPGVRIRFVHAGALDEVPARAGPYLPDARLFVVDADAGGGPEPEWPLGGAAVEQASRLWPAQLRPELSPCGTYVYRDAAKSPVQPVAAYTLRQLPVEPWVLAADIVAAIADLAEVRLAQVTARPGTGDTDGILAAGLHDFLTTRAASGWALWSYTGSVVSGLIADLERRARAAGNPVLRGPSEHSLACGALARWMLDQAPFLIVVTSGMVDEFRGTLANLRQAGARGFVVCADSAEDRWFPFQGTVHAAEDSRAVLRARRLKTVYLSRADRLEPDLQQAYAAYDAGQGPVVLLATASVLQARGPAPAPAPPAPAIAATRVGPDDQVETVLRMVNHEPATLLWQVGALPPDDVDLLYSVADRAGAALADSLARPGTVCAHRDGTEVPNYLGTLGLYGSSDRILDYLYEDGRLKPKNSQALFFLASRITEVSTPFSNRVLQHGLRIVQVTDVRDHLAPFADHPILGELGGFLRLLAARLDVDVDVLRQRRAAIGRTRTAADPLAGVPIRPMTPGYFFTHLNRVIEALIKERGYRYTGVYDVGRGGAAAVRNLTRTGPGFSGWYGRALMGDALQAVPTIALTRDGNVLAFVGDGAAALVPDIVPTVLQQICLDGHRLRGNLSVFRLLNGGHSIIRSYREARDRQPTVGQTTVLNLLDDDWSRMYGTVRVSHHRLDDVDPLRLASQLTEPSTVNLYSVLLGHTNAGDGLSLLSARGWRP
ncbi:hypothetical protein [Micromonospora sp. CPCC 206061]|uniref:hypothetical protein n=1 Tax=Micromonospora sp. CPCC 206061 TaxID=3122410 RepID=UPI002FF35A1E